MGSSSRWVRSCSCAFHNNSLVRTDSTHDPLWGQCPYQPSYLSTWPPWGTKPAVHLALGTRHIQEFGSTTYFWAEPEAVEQWPWLRLGSCLLYCKVSPGVCLGPWISRILRATLPGATDQAMIAQLEASLEPLCPPPSLLQVLVKPLLAWHQCVFYLFIYFIYLSFNHLCQCREYRFVKPNTIT